MCSDEIKSNIFYRGLEDTYYLSITLGGYVVKKKDNSELFVEIKKTSNEDIDNAMVKLFREYTNILHENGTFEIYKSSSVKVNLARKNDLVEDFKTEYSAILSGNLVSLIKLRISMDIEDNGELKGVSEVVKFELNSGLRVATEADYQVLLEISNSNNIKNGGRLYCDIFTEFKGVPSNVFVIELSDHIIGYVALEAKNKIHEDMQESDMIIKDNFNSPFYYIRQCAIAKSEQGKGYGSEMYNALFSCFPNIKFYSHVNVLNLPSLKLHYNCGFNKIGVYSESNFHGINKEYVSDLVCREAKNENRMDVF